MASAAAISGASTGTVTTAIAVIAWTSIMAHSGARMDRMVNVRGIPAGGWRPTPDIVPDADG